MKENFRAVVVAQLVERSPLTPEIRDSTPVIGKLYTEHFFTVNCVEKAKMKKKTPGMAHHLSCYSSSRIFGYKNHLSLSNLSSVTRLGDLLDFGEVFKVFGNN